MLNKVKKPAYEKSRVFYKFYINLENENILHEDRRRNIPFYTPFIVANIHVLSKSAAHPGYCLVVVDLFTSKVYIYQMKKRNLLSKKLGLFYNNIERKRKQVNSDEKMRLQTDLEFQQNRLKTLNKKFNIEMFRNRARGGKAYATEQKIREFKKLFLKQKIIQGNNNQKARTEQNNKKSHRKFK